MPFSRRQFLKSGAAFIFGVGPFSRLFRGGLLGAKNAFAQQGVLGLHEALYYSKMDEDTVRCELCPHGCLLGDRQRGFCRVRECRNGKLYSLVYERPCSMHVDPIEKKPIYHMLPASKSFSIATVGCNSRCKFCQNWQISQTTPEESFSADLTCAEVVNKALESGCKSIAYTYSEPNVFYEYGIDTARIAKSKGIKNVWVTGGMINPEPLKELSRYIDAANIDFKAFDDNYLKTVCAQNLKTITDTIKISKDNGIWIELTNLIVPTLNDDPDKIKQMALWIKDNVGSGVPLHFSRFWPMYKLKNLPPTPVTTLEMARDIALNAGLEYVYTGNIPGHAGNNTYCPSCKNLIIHRRGYAVSQVHLKGGDCKFCGHRIPGIWQ